MAHTFLRPDPHPLVERLKNARRRRSLHQALVNLARDDTGTHRGHPMLGVALVWSLLAAVFFVAWGALQ
jgi:hypothetical protein